MQSVSRGHSAKAGAVPTVLVVNFLEFVGAGWHTTGDALLASTAADMARRRREAAREANTTALAT
jgi:hypothetical protein